MKRRIFAMLLLALIMATLLVGCKKKTTCELCEEEKWCEKVEYDGETGYLCPDCKEEFEDLKDLLDDLNGLFD